MFDLRAFALRGGAFEELLRDEGRFRQARVRDDTVEWPDGADLDPDVAYQRSRPATVRDRMAR